jgi:acetoin utilization deacetylase AcuC-like enzyme
VTTLLVSDPLFLTHVVPSGHPERSDRLRAITRALSDNAFAGLVRREPEPVDDATLLLAHTEAYVAELRAALPADGIMQIESDTYICPRSLDVAANAVGAAVLATDAVMTGEAANAFCAIRPPGHHAEADMAMGFCLFNSAAIAARHAQRKHGIARVAIVDWDVHHGNGTQAIFWSDPSVLYASTHQMPLYPGTGAASETGAGNIVNTPLRSGAGTAEFQSAFNGRVLPALHAFAPDLIIVSAGFDAHWRDPLAGLKLNASDFAWATRQVMAVADERCGGRVVSLLEGGYDLEALADSVSAHVTELMKA